MLSYIHLLGDCTDRTRCQLQQRMTISIVRAWFTFWRSAQTHVGSLLCNRNVHWLGSAPKPVHENPTAYRRMFYKAF